MPFVLGLLVMLAQCFIFFVAIACMAKGLFLIAAIFIAFFLFIFVNLEEADRGL